MIRVREPDDPQQPGRPQPPVAARHRLVRHPEDLRDGAERSAPVDAEALGKLPVEVIGRDAFHQLNGSRCR